MKSVLLIGATGLIGRECLNQLLEQSWVGMVTVLSRKDLGIKNKKLVCEIVDFENIEKYKRRIKADVMISAFGTTIKKANYDQNTFYKWEVDFPLNTARIAHENGCRHFIFVSTVGVSQRSFAFYSRTKAKMEALAAEIGFDSLDIFKPSFLLGERDEKRPAEELISKIMPSLDAMLVGPFQKYRSVAASDVARAIVASAETSAPGIHSHTWADIQSAISRKK